MKKETKTMPKLIASVLIAGGLALGCGVKADAAPQKQKTYTQDQINLVILAVKSYVTALETNDIELLKKVLLIGTPIKEKLSEVNDKSKFKPLAAATLRSLKGEISPEFYAMVLRNAKDTETLSISAYAIGISLKNYKKLGLKKENVLKTKQIFENNTPINPRTHHLLNNFNQQQK